MPLYLFLMEISNIVCPCNPTNTETCNSDGSCVCKAGFGGDTCEAACEEGKYPYPDCNLGNTR